MYKDFAFLLLTAIYEVLRLFKVVHYILRRGVKQGQHFISKFSGKALANVRCTGQYMGDAQFLKLL